jgi:hypothetical protein
VKQLDDCIRSLERLEFSQAELDAIDNILKG